MSLSKRAAEEREHDQAPPTKRPACTDEAQEPAFTDETQELRRQLDEVTEPACTDEAQELRRQLVEVTKELRRLTDEKRIEELRRLITSDNDKFKEECRKWDEESRDIDKRVRRLEERFGAR